MPARLLHVISLVTFVSLLTSYPAVGQLSDFATVNFMKADSIARLYPSHSIVDVRELAGKLTKPLPTEVEKFRAIYQWICLNIENDYSLYLRNKEKREKVTDPTELKQWNKKMNPVVFETLRKKHRTVCTGYAYLVRELALHAGLSCEIIDGYGRTAHANMGGSGIPNHSWNAIQLDNKWYLCDATWSSGAIDPELKIFVKKYNNSYFLADPDLFIRNHYPLDTVWSLADKRPSLPEYLNRPLIYSSLFDYEIKQLHPETFDVTVDRGKAVSFKFERTGDKVIEKIELQIIESGRPTNVHPQLQQDFHGALSFEHQFQKKGKYLVRVLLNDSFVVSYRVNVL